MTKKRIADLLKEEVEKSNKTMTGQKPTKVEIEPQVK